MCVCDWGLFDPISKDKYQFHIVVFDIYALKVSDDIYLGDSKM